MTSTDRVKVSFKLTKDEDDYPPAEWERLWAVDLGGGRYKIDNVPFFVRDISTGDVVMASRDGQELIFKEKIENGGHSTLRIIVEDQRVKERIRNELSGMGCETEASHIPSLFSVDVPAEVQYNRVLDYLKDLFDAGVLDFEDSCYEH